MKSKLIVTSNNTKMKTTMTRTVTKRMKMMESSSKMTKNRRMKKMKTKTSPKFLLKDASKDFMKSWVEALTKLSTGASTLMKGAK